MKGRNVSSHAGLPSLPSYRICQGQQKSVAEGKAAWLPQLGERVSINFFVSGESNIT